MTFDIANWMSFVDDAKRLTELSIPGTHDSAAIKQQSVSNRLTTQTRSLRDQLEAGIRFLDIRARYIDDAFKLYHENTYLNLDFATAVNTCKSFLAQHPRETIIMSIKEESTPDNNKQKNVTYEDRFDQYVNENPSLWYLRGENPTLAEVRGKIVLFRRFPAKRLPKGIAADPGFQTDTTFEIKGTPNLMIQDEFVVFTPVGSILTFGSKSKAKKRGAVEHLLNEALTHPATDGTLYVNFCSGAGPELENPIDVADYINPWLAQYLAANAGQHRFGIVIRDYEGTVYPGTDDANINTLIARSNVSPDFVPSSTGYWIVRQNAVVTALGSAREYPRPGNIPSEVIDIAATPTGSGYLLLLLDGTVRAYGQASAVGGESVPTGTQAVSIAVNPASVATTGYWILAKNGKVRAYNAPKYGQIEDSANLDAVSIVPTPKGDGYWILASNGRVHQYGNAARLDDLRDANLRNDFAVSMAVTPDGEGYWILLTSGEVHAFGTAVQRGQRKRDVIARALAATPDGGGYWVLYKDGNVEAFGNAPVLGNAREGTPAVGIAVDPVYYFLKNKGGDVVEVAQGGTAPAGASPPPQQGTLSAQRQNTLGRDNQLWMLIPSQTAFPYVLIANKGTLDVIDVKDANRAPHAPLIAYSRNTPETDNQRWRLVPSDGTAQYVFITSGLVPDEVIDIRQHTRSPAEKTGDLQTFTRNRPASENQLWSIVRFF